MAAHSFIIINGIAVPSPGRGLNHVGAQLVSAGKNANGEFIGQKVGRTQIKFEGLFWPYLKAKTWAAILAEVDKFKLEVVFCHPRYNTWKTITMYPGNWADTPFHVDRNTGLTLDYLNCKVDIIDCGLMGGL
jgi:hypothetical protein